MAALRFLRLSLQELSRCALWLSARDHQGSRDPASPTMALPPLSPSPPLLASTLEEHGTAPGAPRTQLVLPARSLFHVLSGERRGSPGPAASE